METVELHYRSASMRPCSVWCSQKMRGTAEQPAISLDSLAPRRDFVPWGRLAPSQPTHFNWLLPRNDEVPDDRVRKADALKHRPRLNTLQSLERGNMESYFHAEPRTKRYKSRWYFVLWCGYLLILSRSRMKCHSKTPMGMGNRIE